MKKGILTLALVLATALYVDAQPAEGNPGGAPAPIPGLVWLAAAGAAVGIKAVSKKKED